MLIFIRDKLSFTSKPNTHFFFFFNYSTRFEVMVNKDFDFALFLPIKQFKFFHYKLIILSSMTDYYDFATCFSVS